MYLYRCHHVSLSFFYLSIKKKRRQLLCKLHFMYSVRYFNKLYLQNFLTTRHYSMGIFNELWLRKEASYCWPGLFDKRARSLRDPLPGRTGADMPLELSLTHSASLFDSTLVVRKCACPLPSSWKQWSLSSSGAAQEMVPWPHNV